VDGLAVDGFAVDGAGRAAGFWVCVWAAAGAPPKCSVRDSVKINTTWEQRENAFM
jgi:hypothetical protein